MVLDQMFNFLQGLEGPESIKNIIKEVLSKLDLVTREEFECLNQTLSRVQVRALDLERRVEVLEKRLNL